METKESISRGKWKNKAEAILSCVGYAVGIGNIWRFPYLTYKNGGGAFLMPYIIMLFMVGMPLFFMEFSLGQFSSTGCTTVFKLGPLFKGAGYAMLVVNMIFGSYANLIITYPLMFLMYAYKNRLPWSACDNYWNTKDCIELKENSVRRQSNATISRNGNRTTAADEFLHLEILKISSGIEDVGSIDIYVLLCNIVSWIIVYLCIMRGIKSVGRVIYFTALFPFVVLFCLLIRGLTLPGAWDGVYFYIWPQWDQLGNLKVWADAALQIFFSLGPGWGGIVNISSYNNFRNNCKLDSIVVPIVNCSTAILSGFVVFSVIGFMAHETGMPVSTVASGGPSLAFITYPAAISLMPWPNLWAILFFLMMYNIGIDTLFVCLETVVTAIVDDLPYLRKFQFYVTISTVLVAACFSIIYCTHSGMYWLQLFDWYSASISVVVICLSEVIVVGWTYGMKRFIRDVEFMTGEKLSWYWSLSWKFITPLYLARFMHSLKPSPDWGPARPQDRSEWRSKTLKIYLKENVTTREDVNTQQFLSLCNNEENK
ncbi:unnamed protein product [Callosobruchus maculatus]|uniref:Transporter n=1 Tax=Callosobruchus maculatus TaxID=64391 RepID=A0A653CZH9_CALMS|nr:unnamed protein product [Callosobruchus maculatus]